MGGLCGALAAGAISIIGAHATSRTSSSASGTSATPSVTVADSVYGDIVVSVMATERATAIIEHGTLIWEAEGVGADIGFSAQYHIAPDVNTVCEWTITQDQFVAIGMAVAPADVVTPNTMEASLTWNANAAGDNVTNYNLYWGYASGLYDGANSPIDVGNVTAYSFDEITPVGLTVYFSLSAENSAGESAFSAEVSKAAAAEEPPAVVPVLSNFSINGSETEQGCTAASITTTNKPNGTIFYAAVTNGGAALRSQIEAGVGGDIPLSGLKPFCGSMAITAEGTILISQTPGQIIRGLKSGTLYQVLAFHRDIDGNESDIASVDLQTTAASVPLGGTIYSTGFGVDVVTSDWFFYDSNGGKLVVTDGVLRHTSTQADGTAQQGRAMVGFGKLPPSGTPFTYKVPAGVNGTRKYDDVTITFPHKIKSPWTNAAGHQVLCAISVFADDVANGSVGQEAARLDVYMDPTGTTFGLEPRNGVDPDDQDALLVTQYDDVANSSFQGFGAGAIEPYAAAYEDQTTEFKIRLKLNQFGDTNGIAELWINGILDCERTNLNLRREYSDYGINGLALIRHWTDVGCPSDTEVSEFDSLLIVSNTVARRGGLGAGGLS